MNTRLPLPEPDDPDFGPVIYAYTRADAIADGVLVDVTDLAQGTGFKLPVAITEALHNRLTPTKADQALGQDYDGRLWDVLWLAAFTGKLADPATSLRTCRGTDTICFTVSLQEAEATSSEPQNTDLHLRAVCGPGDEGEPVKATSMVVTIGFPEDF